jgi:hypothetical protein
VIPWWISWVWSELFCNGEDLWWDAELIAIPYDKTDFIGKETSQIYGRRRCFGRKPSLRNVRWHLLRLKVSTASHKRRLKGAPTDLRFPVTQSRSSSNSGQVRLSRGVEASSWVPSKYTEIHRIQARSASLATSSRSITQQEPCHTHDCILYAAQSRCITWHSTSS